MLQPLGIAWSKKSRASARQALHGISGRLQKASVAIRVTWCSGKSCRGRVLSEIKKHEKLVNSDILEGYDHASVQLMGELDVHMCRSRIAE